MCMLSHAHQSGPAFSQDPDGLQEAEEEARSRCQCPHADTPCTHVAGHGSRPRAHGSRGLVSVYFLGLDKGL